MRWCLIVREFSPEFIYIKGSKIIVADAPSCLHKRDNLNNTNSNNNNKAEPTLESRSVNFALNKEDILHPTSFKTIMRFKQMHKSLIEIAKTKSNDNSIELFHGQVKCILLSKKQKNCGPKTNSKNHIEWYHSVLCNPGETRSKLTNCQHLKTGQAYKK